MGIGKFNKFVCSVLSFALCSYFISGIVLHGADTTGTTTAATSTEIYGEEGSAPNEDPWKTTQHDVGSCRVVVHYYDSYISVSIGSETTETVGLKSTEDLPWGKAKPSGHETYSGHGYSTTFYVGSSVKDNILKVELRQLNYGSEFIHEYTVNIENPDKMVYKYRREEHPPAPHPE